VPNTILLVDDDKEFREEFRECFDNFNILEAEDGKTCLDIIRKPNEVDLVVLDVKMPGLNGIEVLKEIKSIDPGIGIIIMTGYGSKDVVVQALRNQSDDYMEKPMDIDGMRKMIEKVLDSKHAEGSPETGSIKSKIEKVKRFVERNAGKKITLQDAAALIYTSPKYLSRVFKQHAGVEFKQFVLGLKIEKAKALLNKTDLSIGQISYKLGYQNTESFIRIFKSFTAKTPSEFRNKPKKGKKKAGRK